MWYHTAFENPVRLTIAPSTARETLVTATRILDHLAKELSVDAEHIRAVFEMVDAGLSAPFIGRFRRQASGGLSESQIRRLQFRRGELEELDRRRATILRNLEQQGVDQRYRDEIERCMDRFELEDLFVPHRRPEPEVQLALDRGLGGLADKLIEQVPRSQRRGQKAAEGGAAEEAEAAEGETAPQPAAEEPSASATEVAAGVQPEASSESTGEEVAPQSSVSASVSAQPSEESIPQPGHRVEVATDAPAGEEPSGQESTDQQGSSEQAPAGGSGDASGTASGEGSPKTGAAKTPPHQDAALIGGLHVTITPEVARVCEPFVNPDRGVHTDAEALSGAVRILSDRLGRNAALRTTTRRMLRSRGILVAKPLVSEAKAGRHKPLLKFKKPQRQVQGHSLLAIRQAQKERILGTSITIDPKLILPKVRAVFGRHTRPEFDALLNDIAMQALQARLLPVVEADVRLELKERGDQEALRFLSQHLRQVLLTPPHGRHPVAGIDVNARGDWTVAVLAEDGTVQARARIEVGEKDAAALAAELTPLLEEQRVLLCAVGHGKGPRKAVPKLREALAATGLGTVVTLVNEAGLSSYANSELARTELPETSVPERMAISLGRRVQDPMAELLKVDPRHLGLGGEQGLVSKANARRVFDETIESCVAHTGCDLNLVPLSVLSRVPGLDRQTAERLIEAREKQPFETREQLRADGLLTEAQWTSAIAFLRLPHSPLPFDRTSLHPELYPLAARILESTGQSVEECLGRPGVTKGLRRAAFDVDEATWRDLMREFSQPGRDPRPRLRRPELLAPQTDPVRLSEGRVIEGIVTNVTSFGAFVDVGLEADAMVHISEISSRYVRDARELLSIGQLIRARILPPKGSRMALSLKNVPRPERRRPAGEGRSGGGRRRGGARRGEERPKNLGRGAIIGGGGRRRGGPGRGGPRRGGSDRLTREEREDLERVNRASQEAGYNPFAKFFKKDEPQPEPAGPEATPKTGAVDSGASGEKSGEKS